MDVQNKKMDIANQVQDENDGLQAKFLQLSQEHQERMDRLAEREKQLAEQESQLVSRLGEKDDIIRSKEDLISDLRRQVAQTGEIEKMNSEQQVAIDKQGSVVRQLKEQLQQMVRLRV